MQTLDDLRSHRHEKSKQHRWRDKESETKIDQDTRRVVRRVRVQKQTTPPEQASTRSETKEPRSSCTCGNCVCVRISRRDALTTWWKFKFQYSPAKLHLVNQPNAITAEIRWNWTTPFTVPEGNTCVLAFRVGVLGGHFACEVLVREQAPVVY